jgi:hypothetical protein
MGITSMQGNEMAEKKTERIAFNTGQSDFVLLSKAAALDERSLGEFVWSRIVKPWLHGNSRLVSTDGNESNSDFAALGGTER